MAMKSKSLSVLIQFGAVLLAFCASRDAAIAQQNIPVGATMKTSHRFEGILDARSGYSTTRVPPESGASCYVIDNGLRRVFFSKYHLVDAVPINAPEIEFPIWQDAIKKKVAFGILNQASAFNEHGHRKINVATKHGPKTFVQGITKITPRYIELSTLKHDGPKTALTMSVATGAVPVDVVRKLLHNQISRSDSPVEYESIFGYFLQAQQFGEALKELELIERRFPDRREQVERNRKRVRQAQARQVVREVKDRIDSGQTDIARGLGGDNMNKEGVAQQVLLELQDLLDGIEAADSAVIEAREKVVNLVKSYQNNPPTKITAVQGAMLGQFLTELESELSPTNVARLDSYLVQANDAAQKDQEKVALAISGWLMGSNNATPNFALAQSMFQVRGLIKDFLVSNDPNQRDGIIAAIRKTESGNNPRFIANMLAQMKPPEHETAVAGYTGEKPIEFTVTVQGTNANPGDQNFRVLVHLPIQYDPYRRYPLLLTLPDALMPVQNQLDLFNNGYLESVGGRVGRASRNGVIVAAVQWAKPGQNVCGYTRREHLTVLKAMRACFRKFQVNTDRVFLHGHGQGANLVYDVGLAHPEHFAGLIPVGGVIERFAKVHARDQNIPLSVYAVVGEGDRATQGANLAIWNKWLLSQRYVNLILVEYVGRLANEVFLDDMEPMFEWMQFQRRRLPDRNGFEFSIESLRPWDNYYWFLELKGFPVQNVVWPQMWRDSKLKALNIEGELKPEDQKFNHFVLKPAKAGRSMTLWLSEEYVNFEKEIRISGRGKDFRQAVTPSVKIMLEDARRRADRLHPFWARLDCNSGKWQVVE